MAEREPTVSERMVRSFWDHINREIPVPVRLTEPLSNEYGNAMLAAVRELKKQYPLQDIHDQFRPIEFADGHSATVGDVVEKFLESVIADHERRAGGKDQ